MNKLKLLQDLDELERTVEQSSNLETQLHAEEERIAERMTDITERLEEFRAESRKSLTQVRNLFLMATVMQRRLALDTFLAGVDLQENLRSRKVSAALLSSANLAQRMHNARAEALSNLEEGLIRIKKGLKKRQGEFAKRIQLSLAAKAELEQKLDKLNNDPQMQTLLSQEGTQLHRSLVARLNQLDAWRDAKASFTDNKGILMWPVVPVRIIVGFGQSEKDARKMVSFVQRGVILKVNRDISAEGVSVRSVYFGRVVFSGRLPGYGNTIVVDHGQGHHAVYAGFDILKVKEGEVVRPRQKLGFFQPVPSPPRFVFELLHQGKPIDPTQWFRR
jgi:murein DD-endopeptidase MepM/ murein hydrolase activator NlpD